MTRSPMDRAHLEANRRNWDERTVPHITSELYGVDGFLAGDSRLRSYEVAELGDVRGARLVHLQCHFGLDTLSWARLGAAVTGVDISGVAIEQARSLADRAGLPGRFVESDVYDAAEALEERFDIVYTGIGAINWINDLDRWAEVIASLLVPGGRFYMAEFHPILWGMELDSLTFDPEISYFHEEEPFSDDADDDYADPELRLTNTRTYEWAHPLGEVVTSLIDAGLELRFLHEHDEISFQRWPFLERVDDGSRPSYRLPASMPSIPLEYSILAVARS